MIMYDHVIRLNKVSIRPTVILHSKLRKEFLTLQIFDFTKSREGLILPSLTSQ